MRICRFDNDRLGLVVDAAATIVDVSAALSSCPRCTGRCQRSDSDHPVRFIAMWEAMAGGGISDRTKERLVASDIAVVEYRRIMVGAARKMRDGGPAIGTNPSIPHSQLRSFEGILPKSANWQNIGLTPSAEGAERVA